MDRLAAIQRSAGDSLTAGTRSPRWLWCFLVFPSFEGHTWRAMRYVIAVIIGAVLAISGLLATLGIWNPYEV